MGKITRMQSKKHDEAMALVSLTRKLTQDEVEFVFENFNPMATQNVGKGAIFFTPLDLAWELAINSACDGSVIDLAAGIGVLSYCHWQRSGKTKRHVAIELNSEFVEIGKKLLPHVEWYCGNVFDLELLRKIGANFDVAICNPPFGNILSGKNCDWIKTKNCPIETGIIEIALRMSYNGGVFILPEKYNDFELDDLKQHRTKKEFCRESEKLRDIFGDIYFSPWESNVEDEVVWQGVKPNVKIIDISTDDVSWERPYGLPEYVEQKGLF